MINLNFAPNPIKKPSQYQRNGFLHSTKKLIFSSARIEPYKGIQWTKAYKGGEHKNTGQGQKHIPQSTLHSTCKIQGAHYGCNNQSHDTIQSTHIFFHSYLFKRSMNKTATVTIPVQIRQTMISFCHFFNFIFKYNRTPILLLVTSVTQRPHFLS